MRWQPIVKGARAAGRAPNMPDYQRARASFSWTAARAELEGLPGGGLNIAHEAVERHAAGPRADAIALRWLARDGGVRDFSFRELARLSSRFANVLGGLAVRPSERVFLLCGRIPELYVAALGALKHRAVVSPLFSAFGPEPVAARLELGQGRVLVTTEALYRKRVEPIRDRLPALAHVLMAGLGGKPAAPGTLDLEALMARAADRYTIAATAPGGHGAAALHQRHDRPAQGRGTRARRRRRAPRHRQDSRSTCTRRRLLVHGRPGLGHRHLLRHHRAPAPAACTSIVDEADFDAERWYRMLQERAGRPSGTRRPPPSAC